MVRILVKVLFCREGMIHLSYLFINFCVEGIKSMIVNGKNCGTETLFGQLIVMTRTHLT